ncbi:N-acetylglucosamine-6-phosphate deacetylase [Sphingomonas psychrotolerans]|uniref:N-acetylglucosamine-6-phosphate deacetylase n=1 Tax=Sphingomonas psychrotolerans TaxID=1327635 RepID=A0A2K8MD73_9SPHN|nr:N-acetylglucosamine-6-phosphate deacetylase [Sphingomonas psychrotolerans]ATY31848.1 N-acetylglucosamine-6-phosphate deacetylase [Sphingomonas psychrotolerans]
MLTALINGRVLRAGALRDGEAVLLDGNRIADVVPAKEIPADAARHDLAGAMLLPGFIDTQVNGGGGVLFNDSPTVEGIAAIGAAHRRFGTTGFLPTLISDDLEVIRDAVAAVDAAIEQGVPGVLGIHIEGPFLNVERRGIHRPDKIRRLDDEGIAALTSLRHGRTLVTLAPERTTPATIRRLTAAGVIVAAGHSNATYEQSIVAVEAGVTGITHLFNAMSPLTSRAPGLTGAALERTELICGIIVDGYHVSPTTLGIALRCKAPEQLMLVTDAMPTVGSNSDAFLLQGRPIRVVDGICRDADGTIAGSHLDMVSALANCVTMLGTSIEIAARMAAHAPAAFLGLAHSRGEIAPGYRADLVAVDAAFGVVETWIAGVSSRAAETAP